MERQQRPQRPNPPQRPNQNQQYNPQMQQQMYNQQMNNQQMNNQQMYNQQMNGQGNMPSQKRKSPLKIILIALGVIVFLALAVWLISNIASGRISSRVVELEAEVAQLEQTIIDNNAAHNQKVEELNKAIADTTVKEVVPTTSLQRIESSIVPELWLIEGDFIAPNPIDLPAATESVNDSYMQIGQKFVFRPSDRWVVTSQGATYEFGHPQQIWGKIRALSIEELIAEENMKTLISDFFVGYPATEITYNKIFIDDRVVGMRGRAQVTVKYTDDGSLPEPSEDGTVSTENVHEKDIVINVGFLQRSDYALSFIFVYDAEGGSNSQELIDLLLRSGSYGATGSNIKLE